MNSNPEVCEILRVDGNKWGTQLNSQLYNVVQALSKLQYSTEDFFFIHT